MCRLAEAFTADFTGTQTNIHLASKGVPHWSAGLV